MAASQPFADGLHCGLMWGHLNPRQIFNIIEKIQIIDKFGIIPIKIGDVQSSIMRPVIFHQYKNTEPIVPDRPVTTPGPFTLKCLLWHRMPFENTTGYLPCSIWILEERS